MPFKSQKQRRFMYSQHPEIAERWTAEAKAKKEPVVAKRFTNTSSVGRRVTGDDAPISKGMFEIPKDAVEAVRAGQGVKQMRSIGVQHDAKTWTGHLQSTPTAPKPALKPMTSKGTPSTLKPTAPLSVTKSAKKMALKGAKGAGKHLKRAGKAVYEHPLVAAGSYEAGKYVGRNDHDSDDFGKRFVSQGKREKLAAKKEALPDDSFPMETAKDVKNAARAIGRTSPAKRPAVRALMRRRSKALGIKEPNAAVAKGMNLLAPKNKTLGIGSLGAAALIAGGQHRAKQKGYQQGVQDATNGVAKRYYDPEARRQRRTGVAEGALAVGGGMQLKRGAKSIREGHGKVSGAPLNMVGQSNEAKSMINNMRSGEYLHLPKKGLKQTAAGAGLLAAAGGLHAYGNSRRNMRWR